MLRISYPYKEVEERKGTKEKNGNMGGAKNASLRSSIAGVSNSFSPGAT